MFAVPKVQGAYGGLTAPGGSQASREANEAEIKSGRLSAMLLTAVGHLRAAGPFGLTWSELGEKENWHHGRSTHVLSTLHQKGVATRLARKDPDRGGSSTYVLVEFTEGRPTAEYRGSKSSRAIKANAEYQDRIAELEREVAFWKSAAEKAASAEEVDALRAELLGVREILGRTAEREAEAEALVRDLQGKNDGILSALNDARVQRDAAEAKAENLATRIEMLNAEHNTAFAGVERALAEAQDEAAALRARVDNLVEMNRTMQDQINSKNAAIPTLNSEEAAFVDKVRKAITGKADTAVQPTRAASLRALVALADRLPRS
jgi:hypothetical protein